MHILISIILFGLFISFTAFSEQGTMSTDHTPSSEAEASLSGTDQDYDARVEEVQIRQEQEEMFDPSNDPIQTEDDPNLPLTP